MFVVFQLDVCYLTLGLLGSLMPGLFAISDSSGGASGRMFLVVLHSFSNSFRSICRTNVWQDFVQMFAQVFGKGFDQGLG